MARSLIPQVIMINHEACHHEVRTASLGRRRCVSLARAPRRRRSLASYSESFGTSSHSSRRARTARNAGTRCRPPFRAVQTAATAEGGCGGGWCGLPRRVMVCDGVHALRSLLTHAGMAMSMSMSMSMSISMSMVMDMFMSMSMYYVYAYAHAHAHARAHIPCSTSMPPVLVPMCVCMAWISACWMCMYSSGIVQIRGTAHIRTRR